MLSLPRRPFPAETINHNFCEISVGELPLGRIPLGRMPYLFTAIYIVP